MPFALLAKTMVEERGKSKAMYKVLPPFLDIGNAVSMARGKPPAWYDINSLLPWDSLINNIKVLFSPLYSVQGRFDTMLLADLPSSK